MDKIKIGILVGSLRKDSINLKLAKALEKIGQDSFLATYLQISDLPLFNQDLESDFPEPTARLKREIVDSDAILIVTPEYNRSFPGVLKNAIDWASRPYGTNAFAKKPIALIGTSGGAIGTACAQQALKSVMVYLDTRVMGQPEGYIQFTENLIDDFGNISNPNSEKFLKKYVSSFLEFVRVK